MCQKLELDLKLNLILQELINHLSDILSSKYSIDFFVTFDKPEIVLNDYIVKTTIIMTLKEVPNDQLHELPDLSFYVSTTNFEAFIRYEPKYDDPENITQVNLYINYILIIPLEAVEKYPSLDLNEYLLQISEDIASFVEKVLKALQHFIDI